jgi:hypothetical protein
LRMSLSERKELLYGPDDVQGRRVERNS